MFRSEIYKLSRMQATVILAWEPCISLYLKSAKVVIYLSSSQKKSDQK
jgi:hypothetical protein